MICYDLYWDEYMANFETFSDSVRGSLRSKVILGAILPLMVVLMIFTAIQYRQHQEIILTNLSTLASQSGRVIESSLRNAMLNSNFSEAQTILDTIGASGEFRVIYLLDTNGKVIFSPKSQGVGRQLTNNQPDCQPCHRLTPGERPSSVVVTAEDGQRVFRSMYPIENTPECSVCHDPNQRLIGLLLTDIPVAPLEAGLAKGFRDNLLWWGGTILVTILIINLALNRIVIQRLARLVQALSHFGQDRLGLRLPVGDLDEIGQLTQAYNAMGQRIADEAAENRSLSDHLRRQTTQQQELLKRLITAQEDERKRVARELHDELGQSLGGLALHSEVMEKLINSDPERALEQLFLTRALIDRTTQQMYELILALRPSILDDLGLAAALRSHAERALNGSEISFKLDSSGLINRLPSSIETALYRIFQEALSNVVRHSGADQVKITLAQHNGGFEGEIVDNGHGFNPENIDWEMDNPQGLGLLGMQERVAQCSGSMEITSRKGDGTHIRVRIPLAKAYYE
jgi:signal transduction histidine kinase